MRFYVNLLAGLLLFVPFSPLCWPSWQPTTTHSSQKLWQLWEVYELSFWTSYSGRLGAPAARYYKQIVSFSRSKSFGIVSVSTQTCLGSILTEVHYRSFGGYQALGRSPSLALSGSTTRCWASTSTASTTRPMMRRWKSTARSSARKSSGISLWYISSTAK